MNKYIRQFSFSLSLLSLALTLLGCVSCSKDETAPFISGAWSNTANVPVEQIQCTYPGQLVCLHGDGFNGLSSINVNGTTIGVANTLIYDNDQNITFQIPDSVILSTGASTEYIKIVCVGEETTYSPFIIKDPSLKPEITSFSTTTLVAGNTLTISGSNLDGATTVMLPLTFDQTVACAVDTANSSLTAVSITIPSGVSFSKGQVKIIMDKTDAATGRAYKEYIYSDANNFSN